jgi:SAM-dependent methyltransferase
VPSALVAGEARPPPTGKLAPTRWLGWLLFSAASNALLMAVTNAISLDASVPLLWVFPLTLYLLTLILCFGPTVPEWNRVVRWIFGALLLAAGGAVLVVRGEQVQLGYLVIHGIVVFVGCLLCHWNLAHSRPEAERLGTFYFQLSLGGFIGSLLIGLVAPVVFAHYGNPQLDYATILVLLMGAFVCRDWREGSSPRRVALTIAGLLGGAVLAVAAAVGYAQLDLYSSRTFYGFYSVREDGDLRSFKHGNTVHGLEYIQSAPDEPLAYYHRDSPIGRLLRVPGLARQSVGLVGLGVGTLAAYSQPGERWQFIEIDPEVVHVARSYFRYLERARGEVGVTVADARLALAGQGDGRYDLLVMDAFSSDYVPQHLLTREAMESYLRALKPGGLLVFHTSSRLLDLHPVLASHARALGLRAYSLETEGDLERGRYPSSWFALARDDAGASLLTERAGFLPYESHKALPAEWTDEHSDLFDALR